MSYIVDFVVASLADNMFLMMLLSTFFEVALSLLGMYPSLALWVFFALKELLQQCKRTDPPMPDNEHQGPTPTHQVPEDEAPRPSRAEKELIEEYVELCCNSSNRDYIREALHTHSGFYDGIFQMEVAPLMRHRINIGKLPHDALLRLRAANESPNEYNATIQRLNEQYPEDSSLEQLRQSLW